MIDLVGILPVVESLSAGAGDTAQRDHSANAVHRDRPGLAGGGAGGEIIEQRANRGELACKLIENAPSLIGGSAVDRGAGAQPSVGPAQQRDEEERLVFYNPAAEGAAELILDAEQGGGRR